MKIVIIEDRLGRLEQYKELDLKSCREVTILTAIDFDRLIYDLSSKRTEALNDYNCIACHRSALKNEIRSVLIDYCKSNKKPLIFFSGGITSSVYMDNDFPFLHINSKGFYSYNLKLFIEESIYNNNVNLLLLQFGSRWKLSLLLNLRNRIAVAQNKQRIKDNDPSTDISNSELIRRVRDLQINSLIKNDLINDKTSDILLSDESMQLTLEQVNIIKSLLDELILDLV